MALLKSFFTRWFAGTPLPSAMETLLPVQEMRKIIDHERMRCDRSKSTFSLLTLTLVASHTEEQLSEIVRSIRQRLRQTDELGLLGPGRLGIVLPDTTAEGAWNLAGKLCESVFAQDQQPTCHVYVYSGDRSDLESEVSAEEVEAEKTRAVQAMEVLFMQPLPAWKRCLDIAGSLTAIVLASPILLGTAAAIKLTSPGPVFFTQRRDTISGRPFTIYKFRTMCVDAEAKKAELRAMSEQDGPAFKMVNDPRITPIGKFLRKTSIDEIPQLFNVLLGDMSLVGPRPLPCDESQRCEAWQRRRLDVTPGITCIWQVRGRSKVSFAEWARMDVEYVNSRSLLADLGLIFKTIPAVLFRRGAC